jgi:hypothetical protein
VAVARTSHVDVERAVEAERRGERRDDLRDEAVEVGVGRALNVEVAAADVVEGLVVDHEGDVRVLEDTVLAQARVVRLDDRRGDLRGRVDRELDLGLAAVVDRKALEEERAEAGPGSATEGVVHDESLETRAVVRELAQAVEHEVHDLLTDSVVAAGVVVRGIFLAGDELLRVEQGAVGARADLVHGRRLEVEEHTARHELAGPGLGEKGVVRVVVRVVDVVIGRGLRFLAVRLNPVLEAEELPAGVSDLDTGLAEVDEEAFTHV